MDSKFQGACAIVGRLQEKGHQAFLAGGCVRDRIMGRTAQDYDIASSARPEEVEALFSKTVPVGKQFGVILVLHEGFQYEVATFRSDAGYSDGRHPDKVVFTDAQTDAQRRDFTINGLFMDPVSGKIVDYVDGETDIALCLVRAIGNPADRFGEDKLRILRAVRFACELDFSIEEATLQAVKNLASEITQVSEERIGEELIKLLTGNDPARGMRLWEETGLLEAILPEVAAMRECEQPPKYHPEGDVLEHTVIMLCLMRNPTPSLALGVLFHDVAKPPCRIITEDGRTRFFGHCERGDEMAREICRRLRYSAALADQVGFLVHHHLNILDIPDMRPAKMKRFIRQDGMEELMELARLDAESSTDSAALYCFLKEQLHSPDPHSLSPPPLINGDDLIELGYQPGPLFKEILGAVETAQLEGEIKTREEALEVVHARFPLEKGK